MCRGGEYTTVGAEFLARSPRHPEPHPGCGGDTGGGGYYYEVEVLESKGYLRIGFAGTNLGPQCAGVGNDVCSWGYFMCNGNGRHGWGGGGLGDALVGVGVRR